MYRVLAHDLDQFDMLLERAKHEAQRFLSQIESIPPNAQVERPPLAGLPEQGVGAEYAFQSFLDRFAPEMTASTGPRYWGFVTGGTTPAALMGDWLASAYDINLADKSGSSAPQIEREAVAMLRDLFGLPNTFTGVFVSGATMSNFSGLAAGREWVAQRHGRSAAQTGLRDLPPIRVLSATPHSSAIKALAMLGLGREALILVAKLPGNREAIDLADLRCQLETLSAPCIVIGSAGTVNTVDFDDLRGIAALRAEFPFWFHVDGAFGGFAAASPRYRHLMDGIEEADSITIDAHKWLNVPYDSALIFTRQPKYQLDVFQNSAAYLPELGTDPDFFHYSPENSRRFRALPAWFTLTAYGRAGYQEIVERCSDLAHELGARIETSAAFQLLAPVRMNTACFTLKTDPSADRVSAFLTAVRDDGHLFLTPTRYNGVPGIRAALVNWRTTSGDLEIGWAALERAAQTIG